MTIGAIGASFPIALRAIFAQDVGEREQIGRVKVLAWVASMAVLCLPAGLTLFLIRRKSSNEEIKKCVTEEYRAPRE